MVTRVKAAKAAKVKVNAAPVTEHEVTPIEAAINEYTKAQDKLLAAAGAVRWKRVVVGTITGIIAGGAVYYGGVQLTLMAVTAATMLTTSAFVLWMIAFVGTVLAFMAMFKVFDATYNAVVDFDYATLRSNAVGVYEGAKSWVTSLKMPSFKTAAVAE